ncbi:TAXI family TRAP transporter solute-binding subunit [Arenibaculum pallidiluteum]|uniref:TAXI family TRAP transporter solute-binding subunit n=1 Tax=Arenibaculum pallidiluteum TaxID=2812559 RepID=UPI001A966409|nr:TAXI family TRAP transporter solute-binding subunit [Arenibaculum pallidiluteum]
MKKIIAATALALLAATPAKADAFINILTGGTSGVYYPLGVAIEGVFKKSIPGAKVSVQATKASAENLNLVQQGKGELAFTQTDTVAQAVRGDNEAGFPKPLDKIRHIATIYPNYIQIVASKESGIKSLADLKGKRVSVGAPKSGTELNARAILKAAGITYQDLGKVEYLPFGESVDLMKNRQLDATLQSAGLGVASIKDLATALEITVVPVSAEVVQATGDPSYVNLTIPAGTYGGMTSDVVTAATGNALVTSSAVDDETAYQMTKAVWENLDALVNAHATAKQIKLDASVIKSAAPLHPGAARYYKEKGLM